MARATMRTGKCEPPRPGDDSARSVVTDGSGDAAVPFMDEGVAAASPAAAAAVVVVIVVNEAAVEKKTAVELASAVAVAGGPTVLVAVPMELRPGQA